MEWTGKPWERQKGESEKVYEAFKIYRDMTPKRSLRKVGQKLGKSRATIEKSSSKWGWAERVLAYDNELEKEAKKQAIKERKEMVKRHIDMSLEIQKKVLEAFRAMPIEDMSPKDIREFIKMATELERLSRTAEDKTTAGVSDNQSTSLADAIISAYQKRKESGNV